jgi:hypothetical protein
MVSRELDFRMDLGIRVRAHGRGGDVRVERGNENYDGQRYGCGWQDELTSLVTIQLPAWLELELDDAWSSGLRSSRASQGVGGSSEE